MSINSIFTLTRLPFLMSIGVLGPSVLHHSCPFFPVMHLSWPACIPVPPALYSYCHAFLLSCIPPDPLLPVLHTSCHASFQSLFLSSNPPDLRYLLSCIPPFLSSNSHDPLPPVIEPPGYASFLSWISPALHPSCYYPVLPPYCPA